jgi:hypothetical protein
MVNAAARNTFDRSFIIYSMGGFSRRLAQKYGV